MAVARPSCRDDFEVAIFCALPIEYDAVSLIFDEFWDESEADFGKLPGDFNNYLTGRVGKHNVVLVLLSQIGKIGAAVSIANTRTNFVNIRLALLAGICGGVPNSSSGEILLGDVVISNIVLQHDFGSRYPDRFLRKDTARGPSGHPQTQKEIDNLLMTLMTELGQEMVQKKTNQFVGDLQKSAIIRGRRAQYTYPGIEENRLFQTHYRHIHHVSRTCICHQWKNNSDPVCDGALHATCDDLGCDVTHLVPRRRLEALKKDEIPTPAIHVGAIASGDTIMKSGEDRDAIAKKENVIAFEMEGAGIWGGEIPSLVVKGISDYSDCHKNNKWQNFASITSASAVKAILERYITPAKATPMRICQRGKVIQSGSKYKSNVVGKHIRQGNELQISSLKNYDYTQDGSDFGSYIQAESSVVQGNRLII